jgi:hypothetical protein
MKLSELKSGQQRHQLLQSGSQQAVSFAETGAIRNAVAYPEPIEALYNGQPVTILATGDIVGMSPAVQIVDESGQLDWASSEDVTITQRDVLPQTEQQRNRLFQGGQRRSPQQQNQ